MVSQIAVTVRYHHVPGCCGADIDDTLVHILTAVIRTRAGKGAAVLLISVAVALCQAAIHRSRDDFRVFHSGIDEPSHFVTGLMIRDYLAGGFPANPVRFARDYYLRYPKVAFGSWPPLLHIGLGVWLLLLPATRASATLYIDLLTALFAVAAAAVARLRLPWLLAIGVGAAAWLAPVPQALDQLIQADTQYALLSLVCVYLFGAYLDRPGGVRAAAFGLALAGAVMTKNNALFLAISLPLTVLLARSAGVIRRWDAWLAVIPAVVAAAVWQYWTLPFVRNNMKGVTGESTPGLVLLVYLEKLAVLVWPGLLPLALWGIYRRVWVPLRRERRLDWFDAASFALLAGPCLFHSLLPHDVNQRYLLPSLPPLLIFTAYGLQDLLSWRGLRRIPRPAALAGAAALLLVPPPAASIEKPDVPGGYARLARLLSARFPAADYPSVLVEAGFGGEGLLVGEMAVREHPAGRWLLRGSKILRRRNGTLNRQTEVVQTDPREMLGYFRELPVSLLVLADPGDSEEAPVRAYLAGVMRLEPQMFERVATLPIGGDCQAPCTLELYRVHSAAPGVRFDPARLPRNMPLWQGP